MDAVAPLVNAVCVGLTDAFAGTESAGESEAKTATVIREVFMADLLPFREQARRAQGGKHSPSQLVLADHTDRTNELVIVIDVHANRVANLGVGQREQALAVIKHVAR